VVLFIVVLLGCGTAAMFFHRRRLGGVFLFLGIGTVVAAGSASLPAHLLSDLQDQYTGDVPTDWGKHPVIVLLGMGTEQIGDDRLEVGGFSHASLLKALELYQACERRGPDECRLIVSGGDTQDRGHSEAEIYAKRLREIGVKADDIILETASKNTWENARYSSQLLSGYDRVYLVTSGIHLRRSILYFQHFGIGARPVRADYLNAARGWQPNAFNVLLTTAAMHEYVGVWRYHIYNALGWNS
jgi:uncharacterized SAM-binding protein YcdF (DUF218 family)